MPQKKAQSRPAAARAVSAQIRSKSDLESPPPTVSGLWLLAAMTIALAGAALCAWGALCLLFWQGSWQLLYHPKSAVTRTPANAGMPYDPVGFASNESGEPRLKGWWIPAAPDARYSRFTVLYLHGQDGNLGDSVDALSALHGLGLNVFAFDYRGYGQSQFQRPSEARWREDAESALGYLTEARHIAAGSIILHGKSLGANLALELAAKHPEFAGAVLESPLDSPINAIFNDPRARLVPAHLLVRDRFDAELAGNALLIPSLWMVPPPASDKTANRAKYPAGYDRVTARKTILWLKDSSTSSQQFTGDCIRWLDDLPKRTGNPRSSAQ
jgi:uncharacterized protein